MNTDSKDKTQKEIGEKLKEAREKKGLTQAEVATEARININYYAMIERGEVNPSLEKIRRIIKVLKVKSSDILPF